jgi:hypothetical protein
VIVPAELFVRSAAQLEGAEASLRDFDVAVLRSISDEQLCLIVQAAESVARKLSAIQLLGAAEVAHRSRPGLGSDGLSEKHSFLKPGPFLERLALISGAEAGRRMRLGEALRWTTCLTSELLEPQFPILARAVEAGEIGAEAASVIVRALEPTRRVANPDDLEAAEAGLVEHARHNPVQYVFDLAIKVRDRLDPDGVLPREEEARERRGVVLGRERNGVVPIRGALAPATAALLRSLFDEANAPGARPRSLPDDDRVRGTVTTVDADGTEKVTIEDRRSRAQRQHDSLDGILKAGIRNSGFEPGQVRSMAEVTAHISIADLESGTGVGWIDGIDESVSVDTIQRILCDAKFRRAILGNDGEIIAFGKARYPFTPAQKRAMVARDGDKCIFDGCPVPASWADGHHVEEFSTHGAKGKTDVDNGVLLCEPHHDFIHESEWQLKMVNGIPHLLAPPHIDSSQTWRRLGRQRIDLRKTG